VRIALGTVGHFGLAVPDPQRSARWWQRLFDLETMFEGKGYVGLTNDAITIVFMKGKARPETIEHVSFHLPDVAALRAALASLDAAGVEVEDPGDEIGPEAPGSKNVGLWFHDPDGYRWELSVLGK
jgi:catechol 2,3-dioxygenase-like lactoylglutathione lyase family enzyme